MPFIADALVVLGVRLAIRPIKLSRKNALFAGSDEGASFCSSGNVLTKQRNSEADLETLGAVTAWLRRRVERRHQVAQPAAHLQRQPVLGGPLQDPQVSARIPRSFGCIEDAKAFCRAFFAWYNQAPHYVGLGLMTPDQVHYGQADAVYAARQQTLDRVFAEHPERFVKQPPMPPPQA